MSDEAQGGVMAPPGAEHERFRPFVGTFRAEVKIWMGPGDPMVLTGTMVNTLILDGRFLRHDYKGDPSPGPFPAFEGHGFWGYNHVDGKFEGVWVDNASNIMQIDSGTVDDAGKVWSMSGPMPDPETGQPTTRRSVIRLEDDDHHSMEMSFVKDGREIKTMEIRYVRSG